MIGDVTVEEGATLRIESPGQVLIDPGKGLRMDIHGSLEIAGTEQEPVVFRSAADSPTNDDWFGIVHHGSGDLTIQYASIENAYKGVWIVDTTTTSMTATINHCEFRDGYMSGVWVETHPSSSVTISNSTFEDIVYYGIQIYKGTAVIDNNEFRGDFLNAVRVEGSSSRTTAPTITGNHFDSLSRQSGIGVNLQTVYNDGHEPSDPDGGYIMRDNVFGGTWLDTGLTAVFIYNCSDEMRLFRTAVWRWSGQESPNYGVLNFSTNTLIEGDISDSSAILQSTLGGLRYAIACWSSYSADPDYARVRECSFESNDFSVWVHELSKADLGDTLGDPGRNRFIGGYGALCCRDPLIAAGGGGMIPPISRYNVYNDNISFTIPAFNNYWSETCSQRSACWPYVTDNVNYSPYLDEDPIGQGSGKYAGGNPYHVQREQGNMISPSNYPNPFNASTLIQFELNSSGPVRVEVFNILGQRVATLRREDMAQGVHQIPWDGCNARGKPVSSGVYLYRITAGDAVVTKKMVVLK